MNSHLLLWRPNWPSVDKGQRHPVMLFSSREQEAVITSADARQSTGAVLTQCASSSIKLTHCRGNLIAEGLQAAFSIDLNP